LHLAADQFELRLVRDRQSLNRLRKYLLVKSPERPVRTLLMKNLQL
jgi:hypothetical protein